MAEVKLYGIPLSTPFRAVEIFLKLLNISYEVISTNPLKGETRTPEFLAINPLGQIPTIQHGDFALGESHAILVYLHTTHSGSPHYYPSDPKQHALVDQYLHWHHEGARKVSYLGFGLIFAPLKNIQLPSTYVQEQRDNVTKAFTTMERWLTAHQYLAGEEITLADVTAFPEVDQARMVDFDMTPFPRLTAWFERLQQIPAFRDSMSAVSEYKASPEAVLRDLVSH